MSSQKSLVRPVPVEHGGHAALSAFDNDCVSPHHGLMSDAPLFQRFLDDWIASRETRDFTLVAHWFAADVGFSAGPGVPQTIGVEGVRSYWQGSLGEGITHIESGNSGTGGAKFSFQAGDVKIEENFVLNSEGLVVNGWVAPKH